MDEKILKPGVVAQAILIVLPICIMCFGAWMVYSGTEINKPGQEKAKAVVIMVIVCVGLLQTYFYLKIFNTYIINDKGIKASGALINKFLAWNEISKAVFYRNRNNTGYVNLHLEVNGKVVIELWIWPILDSDEVSREIRKYLPAEKIVN
ncbi:MAG: hypothetical protein HZA49_00750 [Planctomycetes bacterium]|nr:hypothetical protein [Planctomycetota bacterium]